VWKGASDYERGVEFSSGPAAAAASLESMGLGAGGRMVQEIIKDPYGFDTWDREAKQRVYVHLMPALAWFGLTGQEHPLAPLSVNEYNKHKFPWFEHYSGMPTLKPTEALSKIHTVAEIDQSLLPDNVSVGIPKSMVHEIPAAKQGGIRDGDW
jgi:hypothetical protein